MRRYSYPPEIFRAFLWNGATIRLRRKPHVILPPLAVFANDCRADHRSRRVISSAVFARADCGIKNSFELRGLEPVCRQRPGNTCSIVLQRRVLTWHRPLPKDAKLQDGSR